jgi:chromosome segregation ATPase
MHIERGSAMMNVTKKTLTGMLVLTVLSAPACFALDQAGLTGEFSLPDRGHSLVDSQDEYYDAVQRLQDADAAVVRARESAIKQQQTTPEYLADVKGVDQTYQAFTEKKNALLDDLQKKNPIYSQMKSQANTIDAQIESARQNPATTPEQFDELYKNRDTFNRQWQQLENDAMDRAGLTALKTQWLDASKKLADLQEKQKTDVENSDKMKAALAMAGEAKDGMQQARAAISMAISPEVTTSEQPRAEDFLCRYSGTGYAGNDAWWTYGWSTLAPGEKPAGK